MRIKFEQLGYLDHADIELGELTLICGTNNVGKTYLNYGVYGVFERLPAAMQWATNLSTKQTLKLIEDRRLEVPLEPTIESFSRALNRAAEIVYRSFSAVFSSSEELFASTKIDLPVENWLPIDLSCEHHDTQEHSGFLLTAEKQPGENVLSFELVSEKKQFDKQEERIIHNYVERQFSDYILKQSPWRRPFVITAERTGVALFQKELDVSKNVILETLANNKQFASNPHGALYDVINEMVSRYPRPVKFNIDLIRDAENLRKNKSHFFASESENVEQRKRLLKILGKMLRGSFQQVNGETYFVPRKEQKRDKVSPLPMYMSSSSVKSLLLLDMYIRHLARPKDILIIDEPELNLHPQNQVMMARLLAELVNAGVHVLLTTHSDFLVREFNHLIMFSNNFPQKKQLMKRFQYAESEVLKPQQVKVYAATEAHTLEPILVDDTGIHLDSFDEIILDQGDVGNALSFALDG